MVYLVDVPGVGELVRGLGEGEPARKQEGDDGGDKKKKAKGRGPTQPSMAGTAEVLGKASNNFFLDKL